MTEPNQDPSLLNQPPKETPPVPPVPPKETPPVPPKETPPVPPKETPPKEEGGVPEKYKFEVPGLELDEEMLKDYEPVARELKLSQAAANRLLQLYTQQQAKEVAAWQETTKAWINEVREDKVFGGQNLTATLRGAYLVIEKFGSKELRTFLDQTGFGNHPELVRFVGRIAQAIGEDKLSDIGNRSDVPPQEGKTLGDFLYKKKAAS